jgi:hypothetical protein
MTPTFLAAVLGPLGFILGAFARVAARPLIGDKGYQVVALLTLAATTAISVWFIMSR